MPETINDVEYLNASEAEKYLHTTQMTFAKWRKRFDIKSYTIIGKGKQKFFRKSDLEPLTFPQVIPNDD